MERPIDETGWKEYAIYLENLLYPKRDVNIKYVVDKLNKYIGFDITNKSRRVNYLIPRQLAHAICYKLKLDTLEVIGNRIGNLSHCSVLNSCKMVSNRIETDKKYILKWEPVINYFGIDVNDLIIKIDERGDNYCFTFEIVGFAESDYCHIRDVVYSFKRTEYYKV